MEYARDNIKPGMKESEVAAMIEGHIHAVGRWITKAKWRWHARSPWFGQEGHCHFTATSHRPVIANEPTLVEIWVCAATGTGRTCERIFVPDA